MTTLKRLVFVLALFVAACATGSHFTPGGVVVYAQSVPTTVHATWTPNAASDNVTNYIVTLDGVAQNAAPSVCTPTLCSVALTITAFGAHVTTWAAQNQRISDDPTTIETGTVTSLSWSLSQPPGTVTGKVTN